MPIPGTTKLHRLQENLGAAESELSIDELAEIDREASKVALQGERLPKVALKMIGL